VRSADVAIVLAGTLSEEGKDLPSTALPNDQDAIVRAVAAANPRTVVVLKDNASALLPWVDAVPAVLEAWFPGQTDGDVVARLLFGLATPSGKLPVTFPRQASDLPVTSPKQWPGVDSAGTPAKVGAAGFGMAGGGPYTVEYSEGLKIGYRWFDAQGVAPLYPFGHGLSYTTFALSNLTVSPRASDGTTPITVELTVRNTGTRRGAEVPQVYLSFPTAAGEPPKRLVGFEKVWLDPGQSRRVRVTIDPSAASHPLGTWDSAAQAWTTPAGTYRVQVGRSAGDLVLSDTVTVRRR
jgi:beta-glucosidase